VSVRIAAAWALASQYASFVIQFAASIVLARWFIGPDELGRFSVAFAAITLITFLQDFGVNRFVCGEKDLDKRKIATAFTVSIVFAGGVALLGLAAAGPIAWFYHDPEMLAVAYVIAASYLLLPQAMCQRQMDFRSNTMIEVGSALANAGVSLVLAWRGEGALSLAWGAFAQQVARTVIAQWRAGFLFPWPLRFGEMKSIMEIAGTNSVQAICTSVTARAPELVIGQLIGNAAVGLFARAAGLALQLRMLLAGAVTGVFYPAFRKVRDQGEPLGPPYLRVVAAYTGITWPAMAGIAILAEPLVRLLYGERWIEAAPLLVYLALSQIFQVALPLYADLPILLGRKRQLIQCYFAEMVISVLLLAIAAPYGLAWVAISRIATGFAFVAIYAPLMRSMLSFAWRDLAVIYLRSAVATVAAIAPSIAFYRIWDAPGQTGFAQMLSAAGLGAIGWLAALWLLRHPLLQEIVALVRQLAGGISGRRAFPAAEG
jgi:O-antigen/teichoic acid export membrane protein